MASTTASVAVTAVPFDRVHQSSTELLDVKSVVTQLVILEAQIDALNKQKSLIYAEAKALGGDVGALKSAVRIVGYVPESKAGNVAGLSQTVKDYLDLINAQRRETN